METRKLFIRLLMVTLVIFDTSWQYALAHTYKIKLAHNLNLRSLRESDGSTLLVRETTLPRGTVIEVTDAQFKELKRFAYWSQIENKKKGEISFLTGFNILKAPGFSAQDLASLNERAKKNDLFISNDYVRRGRVIEKRNGSSKVELTQPTDAHAPQSIDVSAASAPPDKAQDDELMREALDSVSRGTQAVQDVSKQETECSDCESRSSTGKAEGSQAFFNKWVAAGVPAKALREAIAFYNKNKANLPNKRYITINDFTRPSNQKRQFILDVKTGEVSKYYVAHGRGSDPGHTGRLQRFSSSDGSHATPAGFHRTAETYHGKHGLSLRLDGLERKNRTSRARAIVIHAADYVSPGFIKSLGKAGRSHGCPAVSPSDLRSIVGKIKGGSLLYNYAG